MDYIPLLMFKNENADGEYLYLYCIEDLCGGYSGWIEWTKPSIYRFKKSLSDTAEIPNPLALT